MRRGRDCPVRSCRGCTAALRLGGAGELLGAVIALAGVRGNALARRE